MKIQFETSIAFSSTARSSGEARVVSLEGEMSKISLEGGGGEQNLFGRAESKLANVARDGRGSVGCEWETS